MKNWKIREANWCRNSWRNGNKIKGTCQYEILLWRRIDRRTNYRLRYDGRLAVK
jgi:hypothetical protein